MAHQYSRFIFLSVVIGIMTLIKCDQDQGFLSKFSSKLRQNEEAKANSTQTLEDSTEITIINATLNSTKGIEEQVTTPQALPSPNQTHDVTENKTFTSNITKEKVKDQGNTTFSNPLANDTEKDTLSPSNSTNNETKDYIPYDSHLSRVISSSNEDEIAKNWIYIFTICIFISLIIFIYNVIKCYNKIQIVQRPNDTQTYSKELQNLSATDDDPVIDLS